MKKKCIIFFIGVYWSRFSFPNEFYIMIPQWYQYCLGVDVPNNLVNFSINGNIIVATKQA
jgi:hypothetical protein